MWWLLAARFRQARGRAEEGRFSSGGSSARGDRVAFQTGRCKAGGGVLVGRQADDAALLSLVPDLYIGTGANPSIHGRRYGPISEAALWTLPSG